MTEITRKTSFKEAKAIFENPSSSDDLRAKAKSRMEDIKAWLKKKDEAKGGDTKSFKQDELNISGLSLDKKEIEDIMKGAEDGTKRMLVALSAVQRICREAGIEHPATIGMVFNQVCENRR